MKPLHLAFAGLALACLPSVAAAQSVDGTWKVDLGTAKLPTKPSVIEFKDGTYACTSCKPAYSVKADGAFHPVAGAAYFDELSVKPVDAHTVALGWKKGGKDLGTTTQTFAADGSSLTYVDIDLSGADGVPIKSEGKMKRVGPGATGSHVAAGSWLADGAGTTSDAALTRTYKTVGDMVTVTYGSGEHYTAKIGGDFVPVTGDIGGTTVKIEKLGTTGLRETGMRLGKVAYVADQTVSADGKSMAIKSENKLQGTTTMLTAIKQ